MAYFSTRVLALIFFIASAQTCSKSTSTSSSMNSENEVYPKNDLGYSPSQNTFKVYSPDAQAVALHFYHTPGGEKTETVEMEKNGFGVWSYEFEKDVTGRFYRFQAKINGKWLQETVDPYVKLVSVNGNYGYVADVSKINPTGWEKHSRPQHKPQEAVIYELHVRDFSIAASSGMDNKGKFLAFTERATVSPEGNTTGIDYLKELGVTHVHLLPSFDFASIDESKDLSDQYNWGYDPKNYNVPEGSYSTDPTQPELRVREFKKAIMALHQAGISVVMDVVYNHVYDAGDSPFEKLAPGVYFRMKEDGNFSDASGCGNETRSDHPMFRKFMIESLEYWTREYQIDGFRFDLMAIHDIKTMNEISEKLHKINPNILLYGEGWTAGKSPLPKGKQALKKNTQKLNGIAAFSDDMRDGIKGSVFEEAEPGLINGGEGEVENVKFGIVGAIPHEQVDMKKVSYSDSAWAKNPLQCVNYVSCHDNLTLFDKLQATLPNASSEELKKRQQLALEIILTSQGIPFLHAGSEFLRTKGGNHNSYKSPDSVNKLDWELRDAHQDLVTSVSKLIKIRKEHTAFRMMQAEEVQANLTFLNASPNTLIYEINGEAVGDEWKKIVVVINPLDRNLEIPAFAGNFAPVYGKTSVRPEATQVAPYSLAIFASK